MKVEDLPIPGARRIVPERYGDDRGYFSETYNREALKSAGIDADFMQDNQSLSVRPGTLRGLHFQHPPAEQAKLVRVIRGRVIDVIVDARVGSPVFGHHFQSEISSETGAQIFVPRGCLHGFITLEADTIVNYKVDSGYAPSLDGSILWNDPDLAIDWQFPDGDVILSEKDATAMAWSAFDSPFRFEP